MKKVILAIFYIALAACSSETRNDEPIRTDVIADQAEVESVPVKISKADLLRVCRGGAAFRGGRKVDGIKARITDGEMVRLSYVRDDGKSFKYDCMAQGNVLRFRSIDYAGIGTGPGVWSGAGSHTTFKLLQNEVEYTDVFGPGDEVTERIKI